MTIYDCTTLNLKSFRTIQFRLIRYVAKVTKGSKSTQGEYPNICLILSQRNVNMYLYTTLVIKKIILFLDADYNNSETHLHLLRKKQWNSLKVVVR